eukprot:gb/GEZN01000840.1/.p1 GENE.gb/GEZN01000840.1/~~gb/GEZN01000840.1/.p1  ORF type:complete len:999 (+),score=144.06 gb/GEZN01000840.1/:150-3146(+)
MSRAEQLRMWKMKKQKRSRAEDLKTEDTVDKAKRRKTAGAATANMPSKLEPKILKRNTAVRTGAENTRAAFPLLTAPPASTDGHKKVLRVLHDNNLNTLVRAHNATGLGKVVGKTKKTNQKKIQPKWQVSVVSAAPVKGAKEPSPCNDVVPSNVVASKEVTAASHHPRECLASPLFASVVSSEPGTPDSSTSGDVIPLHVPQTRHADTEPAFPKRTPRRDALTSIFATSSTTGPSVARTAMPLTRSFTRVNGEVQSISTPRPVVSSARRPTHSEETAGLSMRERLELWRAQRAEQQAVQGSQVKVAKIVREPQASTLILSARSRLTSGDYQGAEAIFARIEQSPVLSVQAFSRADYWVQRAFANEKLERYTECLSFFEKAQKHRAQPFSAVITAFKRFKEVVWTTMTEEEWPTMTDLSLGLDDTDEAVDIREENDAGSNEDQTVPMDTSEDDCALKPVCTQAASTPLLVPSQNIALTMTGLRDKVGFATPVAQVLHGLQNQDVVESKESSLSIGSGHIGTPYTNMLYVLDANALRSEWNEDSPPTATVLTATSKSNKSQPLVRNLAAAMKEEASPGNKAAREINLVSPVIEERPRSPLMRAELKESQKPEQVVDALSVDQQEEDLVEDREEEEQAEDPLSLTDELDEIASESEDLPKNIPHYNNDYDEDSSEVFVPESEEVTEGDVREVISIVMDAASSAPSQVVSSVVSAQVVPSPSPSPKASPMQERVQQPYGKNTQGEKEGSFIALQPIKARVKAPSVSPNAELKTPDQKEWFLSPVRRSARLQPRQQMTEVLQLLATTNYAYSPNPALEVKRVDTPKTSSSENENSSMESGTPKTSKKVVCNRCLSTRAHAYVRTRSGPMCRSCANFESFSRSDTPRPSKTISHMQKEEEKSNKTKTLLDCSTHPSKPKRLLPLVPVFSKPVALNAHAAAPALSPVQEEGPQATTSNTNLSTPPSSDGVKKKMSLSTSPSIQEDGTPVRRSSRANRQSTPRPGA